MFVSPICARSCLRRGEADARITRRPRSAFNAGIFRGRGARGRGGPLGEVAVAGEGCDANSYDGGGSVGMPFGADLFLSAILRN